MRNARGLIGAAGFTGARFVEPGADQRREPRARAGIEMPGRELHGISRHSMVQ